MCVFCFLPVIKNKTIPSLSHILETEVLNIYHTAFMVLRVLTDSEPLLEEPLFACGQGSGYPRLMLFVQCYRCLFKSSNQSITNAVLSVLKNTPEICYQASIN